MEKVIEIAQGELGYLEKKSNSQLDSKTANAGDGNFTKYWAKLKPSYQGEAWCNAFTTYCFVMAYGEEKAKKLLCTPGEWSYYTPTSAGYFKSAGRWKSKPSVGDIIYFKNSSRIHHVGIVTGVDAQKVYTIEGNTSNGKGVIPNGGAVCEKSYPLGSSSIAGYGRPDYSLVADGWTQIGGDWFFFRDGKKLCKEWLLSDHYWYRLGTDGKMLTGFHLIEDKGQLRGCYFGDDGKLYHEDPDDRGFISPWYVP